MAAGLLRHALAAQPEPLKSLHVVSAGVSARFAEPVTPQSVEAMKRVGVDISRHRSQPLNRKLLEDALIVLCMTESHRAMIPLMFDPSNKNIFLFREFLPDGVDREIPDPYGGPLSLYELCRDEMVEAVPTILEQLKKMTVGNSAGSP